MLTRSQTRKIEQQEVCPISLESFETKQTIFVHDKIKFNALQLQQYLILNPNATNPITRKVFAEHDVRFLNHVCQNNTHAVYGMEALKQQEKNRIRDEFLTLTIEELKFIVDNFLYHLDISTLQRDVSRLKTTIVTEHGIIIWNDITKEILHYIVADIEGWELESVEQAFKQPHYTTGQYFQFFPNLTSIISTNEMLYAINDTIQPV